MGTRQLKTNSDTDLTAASNPFRFGVSTGDSLTDLVTSTARCPAFANLLISSIFTLVGTKVFSFCKPSLGPTSTIFTFLG
ncbi:hypothetical protein E2C01_029736 [Portunus trituberculatus]|uniref:Uncharacterized protein n=1 Tax=Portunus trituberculatus TaxID=210409 RepID=A0A5B7ETP7_PORTR|nr:hypothetical protein [Portunus trituberculatus]